MTLTAFTFVVVLAGLCANESRTVFMVVLFSLFGAAAAIALPALGGTAITPALLFLPFVVARALVKWSREPVSFAPSRAALWLSLLVLWGLASAIVLPRVFQGQTQIFVLDRLSGQGQRLYPLRPLATNFTQSVYAIGQLACFVAMRVLLRDPANTLKFRDAVLVVAGLDVFAAVLNLSEYIGLPSVLDYVRTAQGYALAIEYAMGGLPRIHGTFPEASLFAYYTLPLFAFCLSLWTSGVKPQLSVPLTLLLLMCLLMSTSGTAYMGLAVYAVVYLVRELPNRSVPVTLMLLGMAGAALVLSVYVFDLDAAQWLNRFFQTTILDKASSGSGQERAAWNQQAWTNFLETYGIGAGLGSGRASSYPLALLSNLGVLGAALFAGFVASVLMAARSGRDGAPAAVTHVRRAAGDAMLAGLIGATLAVGMFDLGISFYLFAAAGSVSFEHVRVAAQARQLRRQAA